MIEFFDACIIPTATAQQRRQTRTGGYLPPAARNAKAFWQAFFEKHAPSEPMSGPLSLIITFTFRCRKGGKPDGYKTTRPDLDNLLKLVQDAMTKCGYWQDDSQIVILSASKNFGGKPGVYVNIQRVLE